MMKFEPEAGRNYRAGKYGFEWVETQNGWLVRKIQPWRPGSPTVVGAYDYNDRAQMVRDYPELLTDRY